MKQLKKLIKIFLVIVIICCLLYFILVYKDVILSIGTKRRLKGKIVYSLGGRHIKIVELPSGKKKNIYSIPEEQDRILGAVYDPSFSPDGKRVVFSRRGTGYDYYRPKLYIMNLDGIDIKKFLDLGEVKAISPSWSPDGERIAFTLQGTEDQRGGLYIVDVDNPLSIRCISDIRPSSARPAWSPDSKRLAFISDEYITKPIKPGWYAETFVGKIFLVDIDGTGLRSLVSASRVSWCPDGRKLVYEGTGGYYIINEDRSGKQLLVPYKKPFLSMTVGGSYPVIWSPDRKYIAFCKEIWPGMAGIGIYVVSIDNPKRHIRIATEFGSICGMSWGK